MIERSSVEQVEHRPGGAGERIGCTEDHARHARLHHRPGAHRTGLERDVQGGTGQTVVAEFRGRATQGDDLGVRRGVMTTNRPVPTLADDLAIQDHQRADRHFALVLGACGEPEGVLHVRQVLRADVAHSHSMVAGGLPEMSYTTREMPRTSLMRRLEIVPSTSYGRCAQRAVIKSTVSTARSATT